MRLYNGIIAAVFIFVLGSFPVFTGTKGSDSASLFESVVYAHDTVRHRSNLTSITDLIVTLATRPGATDPSVVELLHKAAAASASAFQREIRNTSTLRVFANGLAGTLTAFQGDYAAADQAADVVAARGAAVDKLFRNILANADQAGIERDELELALLSAFSSLQSAMYSQPLVASLASTDRELVNLLMLASVHQVHRRSMLDSGTAAMSTLNVETMLSEHYLKTVSILEAFFLTELTSLERTAADSGILQSSDALIAQQYNFEAMNDISMFRYWIELQSGLYISPDQNSEGMNAMVRVVERMNSVGGIMSNVTVTDLMQSGVAPSNDPYWIFGEICAYDWIRPDMHLRYHPVTKLAKQLLQLGGSVPASPDFSFYSNPYLAVFQLKYDFDLLNGIIPLEWSQIMNASDKVPSMSARYLWRGKQQNRRAEIQSRFGKAGSAEKQAISALFMSPL